MMITTKMMIKIQKIEIKKRKKWQQCKKKCKLKCQ